MKQLTYEEALALVREQKAKDDQRLRRHLSKIGSRGGHSTWAKIRSGQLTSPSPAGGAAYREQMTDQDFRDADAKRRKHG